ncbi:hypothetical protein F4776DRAFT_665464 [Hypoxylon sp. NC0597]|nr:hypothetical protein F4776DRAFT_665464 [Hypoxylon sp. NC0597]
MSDFTPSPVRPTPFQYPDDDPRNLPNLNDEEFDSLTAVLKALARGGYPRLDAVPLALNAYNCNKKSDGGEDTEPWAHFHEITVIMPEDARRKVRPEIELDEAILEDLEKPWQSLRSRYVQGEPGNWESQSSEGWAPEPDSARYRFICFIHKHRIDRRMTSQKCVHTISIWDREWDELTWHDTYHINREARRREIKRFWEDVSAPGFIGPADWQREEFMDRIRYRTVYHICERIEDTIRSTVPPRHTLWAAMGAALFHMNNARDTQVSIVPDRLELFGAYAKGLLPRFFVHLLWLCLDARPTWTRRQQERYVRQFRILERLPWLKINARKDLELRSALNVNDDEDDGDGDGDGDDEVGDGDERSRRWESMKNARIYESGDAIFIA